MTFRQSRTFNGFPKHADRRKAKVPILLYIGEKHDEVEPFPPEHIISGPEMM